MTRDFNKPAKQRVRRHGALPVALALMILCALSLSSCGQQVKSHEKEYKGTIIRAQKGLFQGRTRYSIVNDTNEGDIQTFELDVRGLDAPTTEPHPHKKGGSAKVGALVGAALHCAGNGVKCTPNSSERQPVLTSEDSAQWSWSVSTPKPGKISVSLSLTSYYLNTRKVLTENPPITQTIEVSKQEDPFSWLKDSWQWLLALLGAIGGVEGIKGILEYRAKRRNRLRTPDDSEEEEGEEDPDQPPT
ncbi:hypothetical protein [Streptomyces sirii]|uniref:hypothetical protein n=1 Tax=Streptomyces sirii TaxID=3127701 RepID=UPI003D363D04